MKEIVVNKCYGGFGISYKAVMRYAELKGIKVYAFYEPHIGNKIGMVKYNPKLAERHHCIHYCKSKEYNSKKYFGIYDIKRDDPILVQVVKELKEEANGECAKLEIVEIPDNIEWEIEEYDGQELVSEKHRTW